MQLTIRTVTDIRSIPEALWDEVAVSDRLICSHRFLRAVQDAGINDCRFLYPVVYAEGRIVAHACMYTVTSELDMFGEGWLGAAIGAVARRLPFLTRFRSLECGTPVELGSTISVRPGTDPEAVLRLLADEAMRLAADHRVDGILFRDFRAEEMPGVALLEEYGFRPVFNLPLASLPVRWATPEAYTAALRSTYRRAFRRRREVFARNGLTARVVTDFAPLAEELAALWRQVFDRAREYRREILPPAFFARMSEELGSASEVLLLEREGRILAFALLLQEHERLVWPYCGLDYAMNQEYELYFNLLYEIVFHGLSRGVREIDLGITTLDAKKRVGATVTPLYMYMRHQSLCMRRLGPWLFRLLTPGDDTPEHRVFSDSGGELA